MKYKGLVFDETFSEGKKEAEILLQNEYTLLARFDGGELHIELDRAQIHIGGFDHDMVYFYPDAVRKNPAVLVHGAEILTKLAENSNPETRQKAINATKVRGKKKKFRLTGIIFIISLVAGLISLATTEAASIAVKLIPVKWDEKLGEIGYPSAIASIAPGSSRVDDKYVIQSLDTIKNRLTGALKKTPFKYSITIINSPIENAFALPGGRIVVLKGLLLKARSPEEVAGILAHEITHVEKRHAMKQIVQNTGLMAILQIIIGDTASGGAVLLQAGSELLSLGYSRSMESEADIGGMKLLAAANIPSDGLIQFFKKMSENEKEMKNMEWLLTHPLSEKRAQTLEELSRKYKPGKVEPFNIDWKKIQNQLR
ncbi:MAG: M48 family metallopeptidase [Spirochaetia bacterium]|nr:M48 family metallopeptidase [Spirochaetia bacterium]